MEPVEGQGLAPTGPSGLDALWTSLLPAARAQAAPFAGAYWAPFGGPEDGSPGPRGAYRALTFVTQMQRECSPALAKAAFGLVRAQRHALDERWLAEFTRIYVQQKAHDCFVGEPFVAPTAWHTRVNEFAATMQSKEYKRVSWVLLYEDGPHIWGLHSCAKWRYADYPILEFLAALCVTTTRHPLTITGIDDKWGVNSRPSPIDARIKRCIYAVMAAAKGEAPEPAAAASDDDDMGLESMDMDQAVAEGNAADAEAVAMVLNDDGDGDDDKGKEEADE